MSEPLVRIRIVIIELLILKLRKFEKIKIKNKKRSNIPQEKIKPNYNITL